MNKRGVVSGFRKTSSRSCTSDEQDDGEWHRSRADLSEKSRGALSGFSRRSPEPAQSGAAGQGAGSSDLAEKKPRADETPGVPPRPSEEELRESITHRLSVNPAAPGLYQGAGSSDLAEKKPRADETPGVPPRPSEEELRESITHRLSVNPAAPGLYQSRNSRSEEDFLKDKYEEERMKSREEDEWMMTMENQEVCERTEPKRKKVKKKKNPFMPHVTSKTKMNQKKSGEDGTEVSEQKSVTEQLNELRLDRVHGDDEEDVDGLMEWWSTVKQWEPMSRDEDMTEKEEAQAFALTAEKVQRGIRVFNQLFSARAEALWQHIIDLNLIADGLDRFNKRTKVAQITGGSTSAVGGVATITGLALAPVTMGTSLIVTAVGLGVAAAGGLASASAGISNTIHGSLDRKKVERIVKDFRSKMADIEKCTRFIKRGIENLRELNGPKVKKLKAYESDFSGVSDVYEDGAMACKALLINANEITNFTQLAMATGGTAARAVRVAAMATGILTSLFVAMDVYFVAKDSHELRKGAKSEFARKIREVVEQLHQGLVELNTVREELQCSRSSIPSPSSSISTPASTSSASTSGISSSSSTSTSVSPLSSSSPSPSVSSSPAQNTEAHVEPRAQS